MVERIHLTDEEAARLRRALQEEPTDADGEHLGDEDLLSYAFNELADAERDRVDTHLSGCVGCRREADRVQTIARSLDTAAGREQLDRLWKVFLSAARTATAQDGTVAASVPAGRVLMRALLKELWTLLFPQPWTSTMPATADMAGASVGSEAFGRVTRGMTADGHLRWRFVRLDSGDLLAVFSSASSDLAGATLGLNTDPPRGVVLTRIVDGCMAEAVIPREEWDARAGSPLIERVVFSDGEVVTSDEGDQS